MSYKNREPRIKYAAPCLQHILFFFADRFADGELIKLDGIFDGLFLGGSAVLIDIHDVFGAVVEAERAVQASPVARHSLKKVFGSAVEFQFHQRRAALLDTVHGERADSLDAHLFGNLCHALCDPAALGKDPAVERRIVKRRILKRSNVHLARVEERLKLLKRQNDTFKNAPPSVTFFS